MRMRMQDVAYRRGAARPTFGAARRPHTRCSALVSPGSPSTAQNAPAEALVRTLGPATDKIVLDYTNSPSGQQQPTLRAAKDLAAGEPALTIPDANWLTAQQHPLAKALEGLEPWLQTALVLVHERFGAHMGGRSGATSAWAAYAAALPEPLGSPLFWTDSQLTLIEGTQLLQSVRSYRDYFASKYEELQQQRFSRNVSAFPPAVFTAANFLWAVVTVRSRVHAPLEGDKLALVPLADMVSHSRNANVEWQCRASGLFGRSQTLSVETTRPVRKGEVLQMDFGAGKLDNEVLLDFGVLDAANFKGGYSLALTMPAEDRNFDDKLDVLELAGLASTSMFSLAANQEPEDRMLAFLRLMNLQGADTFLLESVLRNSTWDHMMQPVAQDNEWAVCTSMAQGAREALAGYPTTIEQDLALLRSGSVAKGSIEETALQVRLGEKEALDYVLRFFEQRETLLPTLEYYQERRLKRLGLLDDKGNTTYDGFFAKGIA